MSRRVVLFIALAALAVLGTAAFPWTLSGGNLSAAVSRYLQANYGIDLKVRGRGTIALLPMPRVKFEDVTLTSADDRVKSEGGTLRAELRLLPFMVGRVELSEISLSDAKMTASLEKIRAMDWVKLLPTQDSSPLRLPRVILTSTSIRWADLPQGKLDDVNVVVNWPDTGRALEMAGSASWQGEAVQIIQASINPSMLAADRPSPFNVSLSAPSGSLTASGEAQIGADPRVTGQSTIQAISV